MIEENFQHEMFSNYVLPQYFMRNIPAISHGCLAPLRKVEFIYLIKCTFIVTCRLMRIYIAEFLALGSWNCQVSIGLGEPVSHLPRSPPRQIALPLSRQDPRCTRQFLHLVS